MHHQAIDHTIPTDVLCTDYGAFTTIPQDLALTLIVASVALSIHQTIDLGIK